MHSNVNQLFRIQDRVHKGNIFGGVVGTGV